MRSRFCNQLLRPILPEAGESPAPPASEAERDAEGDEPMHDSAGSTLASEAVADPMVHMQSDAAPVEQAAELSGEPAEPVV